MRSRTTYTKADETRAYGLLRFACINALGARPEPLGCTADERYAGSTSEFVRWVREDGLWTLSLQSLFDVSMRVRQGRERSLAGDILLVAMNDGGREGLCLVQATEGTRARVERLDDAPGDGWAALIGKPVETGDGRYRINGTMIHLEQAHAEDRVHDAWEVVVRLPVTPPASKRGKSTRGASR